jgi:hypothetical protein
MSYEFEPKIPHLSTEAGCSGVWRLYIIWPDLWDSLSVNPARGVVVVMSCARGTGYAIQRV